MAPIDTLFRTKIFLLSVLALLSLQGASAHCSDTIIRPQYPPARMSSDSLILQLADRAADLVNKNVDSALLLSRQVLKYATPRNFYSAIGKANNTIGWAYLFKGRYDSCQRYLRLSRAAYQAIPSPSDMAREDINLSESYTRQSQFGLAIQTLMSAQKVARKLADERLLADINRQLGIIYREIGEQRTSIGYFREALDGYTRSKNDFQFINTSISLAIGYNALKLPDSAIFILHSILPLAEKVKRNDYQTGMILEHLGNTWLAKNNTATALDYFLQAYRHFNITGNTADIAYEGINIGAAYVRLKKFDRAEFFYQQSLRLMDSLSMANYRLDLIRSMSRMYAAQENWKQAYRFLERSALLNDSVIEAANFSQARDIREKYETEKKEQEIILLKKNNEVNRLRLQQERTWKYAATLVIALIVLIAILAINRYRIVQRSKRLVEMEQIRQGIASDLHDDIGSTLSSLTIQSRVLARQMEEHSPVRQNLDRIHGHTLQIMDSMSDIVWAINPRHDTLQSVSYRIREFAGEVLEPQDIAYSVEQQGDFSGTLNPRLRKNLYLIVKEAVNNAAKYAQCSELRIKLNVSDGKIMMTVSDNGIGFDHASSGLGNGLSNMELRATELQGTFVVKSAIGKGTTIEVEFPYAHLGSKAPQLNGKLPIN